MPERVIYARNVEVAVRAITPYLEDTSNTAHEAIYFEGWRGLSASAVLSAIAQDPPPSLRKKFHKIIHVDCSRWKSRRDLQRAIAEELKLPPRVMAIFYRQDEEDDFSGVDEGSREEMQDVGREIFRAILEYRCLVVFHNGSNDTIDLSGLGLFGIKVLWTFRGRLRLNPEIKEKVDNSHLYLHVNEEYPEYEQYRPDPNAFLRGEAIEVARHTHKPSIITEIATQCCLYLLSLNSKSDYIMDYNWATHASSYWVCDEIIQQGQEDEAWEIGVALHQQIRLEDYSSNTLPSFGDEFQTPKNRWVSKITHSDSQEGGQSTVHPETSSFFLAIRSEPGHRVASLPNNMFQQSEKLRVLKLCQCTFSFSSPPFRCCRSLRFLGLDSCKDQPQKEGEEEEEKQDRPAMEIFQSLWVLDICYTDWELVLFPEITEQMATNIREVHIKKGRIWRSNLAWRRLRNLRKLRVFESTCPWETGDTDEFTDMGKLELLDLSRNNTMQVLPSLSGATGLKTLVLDGCVGLEHVGPEGLPPSLESFSLDAEAGGGRNENAKISRISLAGCERLVDLKLRGPLPNLEKLDLSRTAVKTLDLKNEVVRVRSLQQIILLGCEQLRSILWPEEGLLELTVLCIDSLVCRVQTEQHQTYATIMDMRFVQSLLLKSAQRFCWNNYRFHLNLCGPSTSKEDGQRCNKDKMGRSSTGQVTGLPLQKSLIRKTCCSNYRDVADKTCCSTYNHGDSSAPQFQPLDCHVEMGEGISNINVESVRGIKAIIFVMDRVESLHVHDNSSITSVIPERMMSTGQDEIRWSRLKRCRVERCPRLDTVFTTNYDGDDYFFKEVETFWAADLLMARCIWSKGRTITYEDTASFAKLRSIHLHSCTRLTFVLPLSWFYTLSSLETLHIVCCGDLRQVFPVETEFLKEIATNHRKGTLEFPKLKHIHLHDLPSLQQICEAKMSTPMLETIRVRGCWGLRRLPAVSRDRRPTVDCEKDWWEKLEWDGEELESDGEDVGHDLSLFNPRHSRYYKKALPRGSVLR